MIQLKKYTLLLAVIMCSAAQAQEANSGNFSLQQSIEYAMKNSPNYLNAELDLKNADYKRKEIIGLGLPQVNGSIDLKDYIDIPTSLLPGQIFGGPEGSFIPVKFGTKYNATAGLSASQLLFSSDYIFGLKAQKEFMNLSKINVTRSKADLVSQVTKAYYTVLISRERIKSLESNITKLKKTFDDTKAANQQGIIELIDVERLEVQYNNLLTEKEKTDRLIGLSEIALKFQMGYKIEDKIVLTDSLIVDNNFQELNANKPDISQRPDYQLALSQKNLSDLDVKAKKYIFLPTLSAYGSYQYNAQRSEFSFFETNSNDPTKKWFKVSLIGATLNLGIFTGWQRMNRLEQAKITSLKNQNSIKMLEMAAQLEASTASINYTNAYSGFVRQKKNVELAEHVADVARKKYSSGVGSNIEVVTAETALTEAQTNYYSSIFDIIVAKTDYLKATGTLVK
ncbi:MAG: TolC family protein [Bacteroidetes bacterium]|nr:TolC family protein [Bacteroidota bacterium]